MSATEKREVWLRGPLPGIPSLVQPVAHALLQAREELNEMAKDFPDALLWERPAGLASAGFHLQHLSGVLDRLFTYANGLQLSAAQLTALSAEGTRQDDIHCMDLVNRFNRQVDAALAQLQNTSELNLLAPRAVGRAQIPSTVIGLLVHAAEHTQRHIGQLLVTMRVVNQ